MIDLHVHSNASDGDLPPAGLVEKAAAMGLRAMALTDHDTVAGLEEAEMAARSRKVGFIPGVELDISTKMPEFPVINGEFHLLGLGIHPTAEFLEALKWLEDARERRNRVIVSNMQAAGIEVDYETIKTFVKDRLAGKKSGPAESAPALSVPSQPVCSASGVEPLIGRPHFGAFLISRRIVKNQEQAFKRWLGKGRPFYAPREGLPFEKALYLIRQSGGAAVLAHPLSLYVSWGRLPGLLAVLKEKGLNGIEAWHPTAKVKDCKRLEELGRSLGLFITAGSDFHGSARPERKLGFTAGGRKIEDKFLDELRQAYGLSIQFASQTGQLLPTTQSN